jgi:ATP-dependent DNA helicase RecG
VASNILMHREYMNAFPANFNIERGQVRTENSNKPHGFGLINPETFSPFPKNPVIARFFREIGRADELGSGVRRLMKYGKAYGGSDPELVEGDVFRIIVTYPDSATYENDSAVTAQVTPTVRAQVEAQVELQVNQRILLACSEAPLSSAEIAAAFRN